MPLFKIQHRHDTAANWSTANPVLLEGELGLITNGPDDAGTTVTFKVGDGVTPWEGLPVVSGPQGEPGAQGEPGPQSPLSDSVTSADSGVSASSKAVKTAYDEGVEANGKANILAANEIAAKTAGQLGPLSSQAAGLDLNDFTITGNYYFTDANTPLNSPFSAGIAIAVEVGTNSPGQTGYQSVRGVSAGVSDVYFRSRSANTWHAWKRMVTIDDIGDTTPGLTSGNLLSSVREGKFVPGKLYTVSFPAVSGGPADALGVGHMFKVLLWAGNPLQQEIHLWQAAAGDYWVNYCDVSPGYANVWRGWKRIDSRGVAPDWSRTVAITYSGWVMGWDGYVMARIGGHNQQGSGVYINGRLVGEAFVGGASLANENITTFPVAKGDVITVSIAPGGGVTCYAIPYTR